MGMRWRELLFLHFACDQADIQKKLPPGLTVDTFPDDTGRPMAWVGLVPFRMEGVRPRGFPPFQPCEDFPETNVRTYCHIEGRDPGVWFFSLDAANPFACTFARRFYSLNYRHARMSVVRSGDEVRYASKRADFPFIENHSACRLGSEIGAAIPGTLEFFLVERYLLYSVRKQKLYRGQVFHPPYPLRKVTQFNASSGLIEGNGIAASTFTHALFSEGVDVTAGRIIGV
jgi:uncharacterized protein